MKISTILLATIFIGVICRLGSEAGLPPHDSHRSGSGYDMYQRSHSGISYDRIDSSALQELRKREAEGKREAEVKKQIREVEKAIGKISENERYLEGRMNSVRRTVSKHRRSGNTLYQESLAAARTSEKMILEQLETLEEEKELFVNLLERCKCEAATLKVKIDLFGISAKRWAWDTFGDDGEKGPLDELSDQEERSYIVMYQ
ncbi:MAG: hypothetical protein ACYTG7_06555 [Planctomycetota bacterium]|jgi:hypothetical protein